MADEATILHADADSFYASVEQRDDSVAPRATRDRGRRRRPGGELRGQGVRRAHADGRTPGTPAVPRRGRRATADAGVQRGEHRDVRGVPTTRRRSSRGSRSTRRSSTWAGSDASRVHRSTSRPLSAVERVSGSASRSRSVSPGRSSSRRSRARSPSRTGCSSCHPTASSGSCTRCPSSGSGASVRSRPRSSTSA